MPHSVDVQESESSLEDYGQRLLPQIIDTRAKIEPNKLAAAIAKSPDVSQGFREISYSELANAVNYMAWWLEERFGGKGNFEKIAYLGSNDHRYTVFELACIKSGYVALLPSHRNSSAHFQSLFEATKLDRMVFSEKYTKLASNLRTDRPSIVSFQIPEFEDMVKSTSVPYPYTKTWAEAKNDPIIAIHTSGSTGAPKPITYNHAYFGVLDYMSRLPPHNGVEMSSIADFGPQNGVQTPLYCAFPLFHLAGLICALGGIFFEAGLILGPPDAPTTAKTAVDVIRAFPARGASLPPSISNDIVKLYRAEFEQCLPTLKFVLNGGGPLAPEAGDYLTKKVRILQIIGSTEAGAMAQLKTSKEDWDWFCFHPVAGGIVMEPRDDGLFEMVIKRRPGQEQTQAVFQTFPDLQEWRTKDLFRKHSTKPYYRFVGRLDDVLVLANGEKFNPVGMERAITNNPFVKGAVVVGMRRSQVGLLVEKADNAPASDEEFVDAIWPTIQKANKDAPGHAQLSKKMIIIANPEKPFPRAGKGTIIRPQTVNEYTHEIDELYKSIEEQAEAINGTAPQNGMPVMKVPLESIQQFIQDHLSYLLDGQRVSTTEDFVGLGFDSLQMTELSNNLRAGLRPFMKLEQLNEFNIRVIYENPTAEKLAATIYELMNPSSNGVKNQESGTSQKTLDTMKALIEKYTTNLPEKAPITLKQGDKDLHVVLTGSTGYLGQYILLSLLNDPKVSKVICFNRSADAEAKYLEKGGVKEDISKLEFLQVSFGEPGFGLPASKYQELVNRVDAIIHNAWKVDFLHSVESYEDVHIRGTANFVNWSLSAPRSVALSFISSVATCVNWNTLHPNEPVPEAVNNDCRIPDMGYGQSKFIGENILDIAARERGISATVLRSGQIAGPLGEEHGIWNKGEWFPTLMKTSKALGLVPSTLGNGNIVDWIPVDIQASIITDAMHSTIIAGPTSHARAYNMVNPKHVPYTTLLPAITRGLGDPKPVPFTEWVSELKKHDANSRDELEKFPGLKLVGFYEAMAPEQGLMNTRFVFDELTRESRTVANIEPVTGEAMATWLKQWDF